MTDPSYPDSDDDTGAAPERSTTSIWPTVVGIVVVALVVGLVIVLHVLGGGFRGPH